MRSSKACWLSSAAVAAALTCALPSSPERWSSLVAAQAAEPAVREIEIIVDKGAYKPNRVEVRVGERVRLKFLRKEFNGCTREVVFPKLEIRRELPPNKAVIIELPELAAGEYEFRCGMNMVKGLLVIRGSLP